MKNTINWIAPGITAALFLVAGEVSAAPITINVTGTFLEASGTMANVLGQSFSASFSYDSNISNAAWVDTTPGYESGSIIGNNGGAGFNVPYGVMVNSGSDTFESTHGSEYVIYDNQLLTVDADMSAYLGVAVGDYTLDGITLFGGQGYSMGDNNPDLVDSALVTGTEMGIDLFSASNWFDGPTLLGENDYLLLSDYVYAEVWGSDMLEGTELGSLRGSIDSMTVTVSSVPVPAAVWLFGSGLLGLIGLARRKAA